MENKCNSCGEEFNEPKQVSDDAFGCPFCDSSDFDNLEDLLNE